MLSPTLMEKVAKGQLTDRLHDAEIERLLRTAQTKGVAKLKLAVIASGSLLITLMLTHMLAI